MLERQFLFELEEYIERHTRQPLLFSLSPSQSSIVEEQAAEQYVEDLVEDRVEEHVLEISPAELEDFVLTARKPTFSTVLLRFIDNKGVADSEIYKRAGMDRRHFSKIRSNEDYRPGKHTVIALALALELNKRQVDQLLTAAGYSLSDSSTFDLIVRFFLERKVYEVSHINEALCHFNLKPLGGVEE